VTSVRVCTHSQAWQTNAANQSYLYSNFESNMEGTFSEIHPHNCSAPPGF